MSPRLRYPTAPGRGIDQPTTLFRRVMRKATAFSGEEIRLPASTTVLFVETSPFTAGQCYLFFGKPQGNLVAGTAIAGDVTEGIDVSSFRTIRVPPGVDTLYVWSTVAPGVTTGFAVVAFIGDGWADGVMPQPLATVAANATIVGPLGAVGAGVLVSPLRSDTTVEAVSAVTDAGGTILAANANRFGGILQLHTTDPVGFSQTAGATFANCPIKLFQQGATFDLSKYPFVSDKLVHAICGAGLSATVGSVEFRA